MGTRNPITPNATSWNWIRPYDWITMNEITDIEGFDILVAVYEDGGNQATLEVEGNYIVDWGDGYVEYQMSGNTAEHNYLWDDVGNYCHRNYRQALIKVRPQPGHHITHINLQNPHSEIEDDKASNYLDMIFKIPNVSGNELEIGGIDVRHVDVERVNIDEIGALTNGYGIFYHMHSLQSIKPFDTSHITDAERMFSTLYTYQEFDGTYWDFSSLQYADNMFGYSQGINVIKNLNLSNLVFAEKLFIRCYFLLRAENNTFGSAETTSQLYESCWELDNIEIDLNNTTDVGRMLYATTNLRRFIAHNCGSIIDTTSFKTSGSLSYMEMHGMRASFSIANNRMSAAALNRLGTTVANMVGEPTPSINVSDNIGASTMDQTIWTNKNWTIIGA